ncbi:hypothetical protein AAG570_004797 [Ranatra chinensis]|uniref:Uncharacterized protein n=1 Tax=Ranatra chinensis TaxID=642074 RepID=A0ABD0Y1V7_9HEMI
MALKRRNMFHKNKKQETTENAVALEDNTTGGENPKPVLTEELRQERTDPGNYTFPDPSSAQDDSCLGAELCNRIYSRRVSGKGTSVLLCLLMRRISVISSPSSSGSQTPIHNCLISRRLSFSLPTPVWKHGPPSDFENTRSGYESGQPPPCRARQSECEESGVLTAVLCEYVGSVLPGILVEGLVLLGSPVSRLVPGGPCGWGQELGPPGALAPGLSGLRPHGSLPCPDDAIPPVTRIRAIALARQCRTPTAMFDVCQSII